MTNGNDSAYGLKASRNEEMDGDADFIDYEGKGWQLGLTKREYFAAMAMQGILSAEADNEEGYNYHIAARDAVGCADALIYALNEESK